MVEGRSVELRPRGAESSDVGERAMGLARILSHEERYCPECPGGVPENVKADTNRIAAGLMAMFARETGVYVGETFEREDAPGEAHEVTVAPVYQLSGQGGTRSATLADLLDVSGPWRRREASSSTRGPMPKGASPLDALVVELLTLRALDFASLRMMLENRRGAPLASGALVDALDRVGAVKRGERWTVPGTEAAALWETEYLESIPFDEERLPGDQRIGLSLDGLAAVAGPGKVVMFDAAKRSTGIVADPREGALSAEDAAQVQSMLGGKPAECAAGIAVDLAKWRGRPAAAAELAAAAAHLQQTARTINALAGRGEA